MCLALMTCDWTALDWAAHRHVHVSCSPPCRSAYQRAVVVPTEKLEALWAAYENFELGGAAKALGRRALDDMRPRYQVRATSFSHVHTFAQLWVRRNAQPPW